MVMEQTQTTASPATYLLVNEETGKVAAGPFATYAAASSALLRLFPTVDPRFGEDLPIIIDER